MVILAFVVLVACSACSESGDSTSKLTGPADVAGTMIGADGPITHAKLTATDATGAVVATTEVKGNDHYNLKLPKKTVYPVLISVIYPRSTKEVASGQGEVKAALMEPGGGMLDITPTSTRIVDTALGMGGLTPENFRRAAISALQSGMGSSGSSGGGEAYHGGH